MARFLYFPRLKARRNQILATLLTSVVLLNEGLFYAIAVINWPVFNSASDGSVQVLIAADPQILSFLSDSEPRFPLNLFTIWDAERFVSRGFHMALWKTKPDVVVFLGDLLNDGSIASDSEFNSTLLHFIKLMNVPSYVQHTIFVPGDNDIGGEGKDIVTANKINRFYSFLKQSTTLQYKFVDFIQVHMMDDLNHPNNTLPLVQGRIRILLSHIPLMTKSSKKAQKESLMQFALSWLICQNHGDVISQVSSPPDVKILKQHPSFIFSGHEHESFHFSGVKKEARGQQFEVLAEDNIWHFEALGLQLHEVVVPTCSYRMGKERYGYGAAIIEKSGRVSYTVLWLPSRFTQLWIYLSAFFITAFIVLADFLYAHKHLITRLFQSSVMILERTLQKVK